MKKAAVVGFGRFGQLFAGIIRRDFEVSIVTRNPARIKKAEATGYTVMSFEALGSVDIIFLTVPISAMAETIRSLAPLLSEAQTVIDTCSVKIYPAALMQKYLKNSRLLGSHPLFGPDSASDGLEGLKMALCPLRLPTDETVWWTRYWQAKGLEVILTTPKAHDQDTVYSQAFTYSLARIINEMNIPKLQFTTKSYEALARVAKFSARDSDELFHDMLAYNPYLSAMRKRLKHAIATISQKLDETESRLHHE